MNVIISSKKDNPHGFKDLLSGDVFRLEGTGYYMKLDANYYIPGDDQRHNTVNLGNGKLIDIPWEEVIVAPRETTLMITE